MKKKVNVVLHYVIYIIKGFKIFSYNYNIKKFARFQIDFTLKGPLINRRRD